MREFISEIKVPILAGYPFGLYSNSIYGPKIAKFHAKFKIKNAKI